MSHYRSDLAHIHDNGFGHLAVAGAGVLLAALDGCGIRSGAILDVGCGSGITARVLADRGYSVSGVDLSASLIELARKRVPEAVFCAGSFVDMEMSSCVALCAIGEVLNYKFDARSTHAARRAFFERAFRALASGGVLLFDVAGPDRAPERPTRTFAEGGDWAVLVETSATGRSLTRRIVTFRRIGTLYRRGSEVHELELVSPEDIESDLLAIGFGVTRFTAYADEALPRGLHGFLARRPSGAA